MVDAMEMIGAMQYTPPWLAQARKVWGLRPVKLATGFVVGVANNLVRQSSTRPHRRPDAVHAA